MVLVSDPRYLIIIIMIISIMIIIIMIGPHRRPSRQSSWRVTPLTPFTGGAPERHATADGADVVSVLPDGAIKAPAQSALDRARKAAEKKKSAPRMHRADAPVRREPRCAN